MIVVHGIMCAGQVNRVEVKVSNARSEDPYWAILIWASASAPGPHLHRNQCREDSVCTINQEIEHCLGTLQMPSRSHQALKTSCTSTGLVANTLGDAFLLPWSSDLVR